jgi:endonuclease/exonuclease/phosphatase family metal-dependent hydrolase
MRLVTWNIQRGRGADGACSLRRVVADLKRLGEIDIFCLQEVSAGYTDLSACDGTNQFVELTRLLPEYTPISGVATDTLGEDGTRRLFGNMIFSRWPVLQAFRHALPWPADPSLNVS